MCGAACPRPGLGTRHQSLRSKSFKLVRPNLVLVSCQRGPHRIKEVFPLPPLPSFPPSLDPWMSFLSTLSSGTWPPPQFLWAVSVLSLYRTGALTGVPWGCMGACLSASQPSRKGRPCWEVSRECCDFHLPEESLLLIPERTCRGEGAIISFQVGEPG